jgi:hypothetical protein
MRMASIVATLTVAVAALLGGAAMRPASVSAAAYCTDYPELCTTYDVYISGDGTGVVTTADGFIACSRSGGVTSGTCSHRYPEDGNGAITVALTLTAAPGSYPCYYKGCWNDTYSIERTAASSTGVVSDTDSRFFPEDCNAAPAAWCATVDISIAGPGSASIASTDGLIDCEYATGSKAGACSHEYFVGPELTAPFEWTAVGGAGTRVCITGNPACSDGPKTGGGAITEDYLIRLYTELMQYPVSVNVVGLGAITSQPAGLSCKPSCSTSFDYGTVLHLTAAPATDWTFASWSGACAGQAAACILEIQAASSSTATFRKVGASALPTTPLPTLPPLASSMPAGSEPPGTAQNGSTPEPSAEPGETLAPDGTGTGAGASPVPGDGQPSEQRGPDIMILALAILGGAVIIAIGLAFGLRRRTPGPDPAPPPG